MCAGRPGTFWVPADWHLAFEDERCLVRPDRVDDCSSLMFTGRKSMAKKSPASSRREGLTKMTSEDIKNRNWTEGERRLVKRHAAKQAAGDESEINYHDHPVLEE